VSESVSQSVSESVSWSFEIVSLDIPHNIFLI